MTRADAVFAADRAYNGQKSIKLVNETLGGTGIGTHKRSLDFPFMFGESTLTKKHKYFKVAEKGTKKGQVFGPDAEAAVYRERFYGRIAEVYHNNFEVFGAHTFYPRTEK